MGRRGPLCPFPPHCTIPESPARKGHHDLLPVTAETRRESARTREEGREEPARKSPLLGCNKLADYSGRNDKIHSFSVKVNLSYHSNQVSTVSTSDIQHRTTAVPSDATQAREVFPSRGISATPSSPAFSLSVSAGMSDRGSAQEAGGPAGPGQETSLSAP